MALEPHLPWELPQRKEDGQLVVQLLEFIESAEDKLRITLALPEDSHHIDLCGEEVCQVNF